MNRVLGLVFLALLTSMLCICPVYAQTNQGLEWGFAYDDEFHFMMHLNGTGIQIDEEIYLVSNDTLPTIPDSMDNWTDIPYTTIMPYYANDTELGIEVLTFVAMYNVYLPIGNWTFLSTLAQTTHTVENFTLDPEDPFFWGYSWEDDNWVLSGEGWTIWSNYTLYVHVEYLKTDGFIAHYSVDAYNTTTGADAGEITLERMGIEQYRETTAPTIDHPADISYVVGQEGNSITWHASDDYPHRYAIYIEEPGTVKIPCTVEPDISGLWNHTSEAITVVVDGLSAGEYNYTILVYDIRGNYAIDSVTVTVESVTVLPWILVSVVGGIVIVIAAVVFRRR